MSLAVFVVTMTFLVGKYQVCPYILLLKVNFNIIYILCVEPNIAVSMIDIINRVWYKISDLKHCPYWINGTY